MDVRHGFALLALAFVSCPLRAEPIAASFGQEIAGVPWTVSSAELERKLPGGTQGTYGGMLPIYTVSNGRSFLGVQRTAQQTVIFGFSTSGKLAGVSINFPADVSTYGDLLEVLTEKYGSPATTIKRANADLESIQSVWEENGLRVILSHAFAGTYVRNDLIVLRPDRLPESWRNFGLSLGSP